MGRQMVGFCGGCGRMTRWPVVAYVDSGGLCSNCATPRREKAPSLGALEIAGAALLLVAMIVLARWFAREQADDCRARGGQIASGTSWRGESVSVCVLPEGR